MRTRIVHTLSLLLLSAVLLAVMAMGAVTAWNLESGFADYLEARDAERLEQFAALVSEVAAQAGSLEALEQRTDMRDLLRQFAQLQGLEPGGPPGPAGSNADGNAAPGLERPLPDGPPRAGPPPGGEDGFGARVMVVDINGQALLGLPAGPPRPTLASPLALFIERPITLNGKVIALARMRPGAHVPDAVEARFLRSQYLGILAVSLALLFLALASAWWVARRLARPLHAVQAATDRIARGEFDVRLHGRQEGEGRTDEIGDLVRNVNRMAEGLQRLEGARRRWLAEISHELRTPLSVLRGETEALMDGVRPLRPEAIASLHEDVLRLGKLVDDLHLLAMSDLQSLPCTFDDLDVLPLIQRAVARFQPLAAAKGLELDFQMGTLTTLPVHWDSARIEQLLSNLLENSVRYTDAPGCIVLALKCQGDMVTLEIEDSAPGVPETELSRLFEPLYRADSARSRHRGGSGLGLAISEAIVRSHGGRIEVAPSSLGGLRIYVELPAKGDLLP
jgi:two-component system, OmpR family, sensor histidine kinase BaeS